jgi:hypothetical protein
MNTNEWITMILAIAALISTIILTVSQIKIAKASNSLPVGIDLLREYRETEFKNKASKTYVLLKSVTYFKNLTPEQISSIDYISHFYDNLGLLVHKNIISKDLILSFMGGNIQYAWHVFEDYIQFQRRQRSNNDYQSFFEFLNKESESNSETNIRKKLGLK